VAAFTLFGWLWLFLFVMRGKYDCWLVLIWYERKILLAD